MFVGITAQKLKKSLISLIQHASQIQDRVFLRSPKRRRHAPQRVKKLDMYRRAISGRYRTFYGRYNAAAMLKYASINITSAGAVDREFEI